MLRKKEKRIITSIERFFMWIGWFIVSSKGVDGFSPVKLRAFPCLTVMSVVSFVLSSRWTADIPENLWQTFCLLIGRVVVEDDNKLWWWGWSKGKKLFLITPHEAAISLSLSLEIEAQSSLVRERMKNVEREGYIFFFF